MAPLSYEHNHVIAKGQCVEVLLRTRKKRAVVLNEVEKPEFKTSKIQSIEPYIFKKEALDLAYFIAAYYVTSLGMALALFTPHSTQKRASLKEVALKKPDVILSKPQEEALSFLREHQKALLFGDTGSGKTEIYIHRIYETLQKGQKVLFLLPEISLTPQMQSRLEAHFGTRLMLWHSKLSKKKRQENLEAMYEGRIDIVAGPRSILFLPLDDVGLIIVDEEHDESYKSNQNPRYHARDLAILMANRAQISLILGSATPSLTSYTKFPHFRLKGSFFQAKRSIVFEASREAFTPLIQKSLEETFKAQKQALLFVPTRANFKYLICQSCGAHLSCPFCSVGMSVHTKKHIVRCHYCNFSEPIPKVCPSCKHPDLSANRLGTAELVKSLQEHFSDKQISAFDRDHIRTDRELKKVLKAFNHREIDALVGTQMLSKGHDYHHIALAVILGIDHILSQSDYRARERALSLLIQIMGRAGRKEAAHIIIQSFNEPFFRAYIDDYKHFLDEELEFRRDFYPPFRRLARILFAHKNDTTAQSAMEAMRKQLQNFPDIEIMGSGKAFIERIANKFRYTILLRSSSSQALLKAIKTSLHPLAQVDMDPIDFT